MAYLNELPPCLLLKVFSYLPISEVIRLKLVCKAWQEISAFVRFKSLSIYRYDFEKVEEQPLIKPERFPENFDLYINDFEKFFRSTGPMVNKVQRLVVCLYAHPVNYENKRLEKFLHRFRLLEELELRVLGFDYFPDGAYPTFSLKLKRLRKLEINYKYRIIKLDCPQLSYLDVEKSNLSTCRIRYPEKLRTLVVSKSSLNRYNFRRFVNLRNLVLDLYFGIINEFTGTFFAGLPKSLRRLAFFFGGPFRTRYLNWLNFEDYLNKSYTTDREDSCLRVFYLGIELSLSRFTDIEREPLPAMPDENSKFMLANLASSVDANFCLNDQIDYETLERHLPSFDPFYEKLHPDCPYLCLDISENVTDHVGPLKLIEKSKASILSITAAFPRSFYERLAEIGSSSIQSLTLNAASFNAEPGVLDFLLRMNGLYEAVVENCPPLPLTEILDLLISAFEKLKNLIFLNFFCEKSFWSNVLLSEYFILAVRYRNEDGVEKSIERTCEFERNEQNGLDVLRYLNARLKQNSHLRAPDTNQIWEGLESLFLTEELEHQAWQDRFAFRAIKNYTKAIPIYCYDSPRESP